MTRAADVTEIKFYTCEDVMRICGVGRNKAYSIIKSINKMQEQDHKMVIPGKVNAFVFNKMF